MANLFAVQLCELLNIPVDGVVGLNIACDLDMTKVTIERQIRNSAGRPVIADHLVKTIREDYELVRIASRDSELPAEIEITSIDSESKRFFLSRNNG